MLERPCHASILRIYDAKRRQLAVVSHSEPSVLGIRKSDLSSQTIASNLERIRHEVVARRRIDDKLGSRSGAALKRDSTEKRLLRSTVDGEDVDRARSLVGDWVALGEVDFELAAIGAGGDVAKSHCVGSCIGTVGVLVNVVVDGEAD